MNRVLLSMCLFGAALAIANTLLMPRPMCSAGATKVVADKNELAAKTVAAPVKAPTQPPKASETAAISPAPPTDGNATGSVKPAARTENQQFERAELKKPEDVGRVAPVQPKRSVKRYRPRKYGWRRYRYPRPPVGFAIRLYPGW